MSPSRRPDWGPSRPDDDESSAANAKPTPSRPATGPSASPRPSGSPSPNLPPAKPLPGAPSSPSSGTGSPEPDPKNPPARPLRPNATRDSAASPTGRPALPAAGAGAGSTSSSPGRPGRPEKGTLASPSAGKPGSLPGWKQGAQKAAGAARNPRAAKANAKGAAKQAAKKYAVKSASTAASATTGIPQPIIEKAMRHWRGLLALVLVIPTFLLLFIILAAGSILSPTAASAACTSAASAATVATAATSGPTPPADQLSLFMAAERWQESRNNYTEPQPGSGPVWDPNYNGVATASSYKGAFGAYQFEQPTWYTYASLAGYPEYKNTDPVTLSPTIQDAVATVYYTSHYNSILAQGYPGNIWVYVAEMTIYPKDANPSGQNVVVPGAGNGGITVGEYGTSVVNYMTTEPWLTTTTTTAGSSGTGSTTTTAVLAAYAGQCGATGVSGPLASQIVQIAEGQIGLTQGDGNSAYGANAWGPSGEPWCAFFASWVLAQAGVQPTVPSMGYSGEPWKWIGDNGGIQLPPTATPQPGDLVFFGSGYDNYGSHHVAIITQVLPDGKVVIVGGNSGSGTNSTSTVGMSTPVALPLTQAAADRGGWPGPVWGYAQPPGV